MVKEYPFDMTDFEPIQYRPDYLNNNSVQNLNNGISHFHLKTEIMNCNTCNIFQAEHPLTLGNMHGTFMIVGERPDDVSFETEQGKVLGDLLKQQSFDFNALYLTAAAKSDAGESCFKHLSGEIITIHPMMIFITGEQAAYAVLGEHVHEGVVGTLPNGSDFVVAESVKQMIKRGYVDRDFTKQLQIAINQWRYRLQQRSYQYV